MAATNSMQNYFQFGAGIIGVRPTSGNLATPSDAYLLGTVQKMDVEFTGTLKDLRGQNQWPDDVAASDKTLSIKGGVARINPGMFSSLFFGDTVSTGALQLAPLELHTIPGTPYTVTIAPPASGTYSEDYGVVFQSNGEPLDLVTGTPSTGQYAVNTSTGVYTFAAADTTLGVAISYTYTTTTGHTMGVQNHVQGWGPECELVLSDSYQPTPGNLLRIYRVKFNKMSLPHARDGYVVSDIEGQAFATTGVPSKVFDWCQAV